VLKVEQMNEPGQMNQGVQGIGVKPNGRTAAAWTPTQYANNGAVQVAFDRMTGPDDQGAREPLLLIMGLGTSRFWWPAGLCEAFVQQGFDVARYDQRDAGQSTRMPDTATSNPFAALFGKMGTAYTAEDMADDAVAALDGLGWERAHLFGHSLGGAIAQRIALRHPKLGTGSGAIPALRAAGQARSHEVPRGSPR